jgi:hypothetical protein
VEANGQDNQLQVFFDGKPDADIRGELKSNGFRWTPDVGAWQTKLNDNAFIAADKINSIQPITGEKPTELLNQARTQAAQHTPPTQAAEQAAPSMPANDFNLTTVADYMQKQNETIHAADPDKTQGQAAYSAAIKRLEQATGRIPDEHPQLKALLSNAAQSPDLATLKERMNTLNTEFIQHYSTAVQMSIDTSGKAEPPTPAATVRQTEPAPAQKPPAQGENVAAIEARVNAGEVINLTDLSDAIKKDKAAAQVTPSGKDAPQAPAKPGTPSTAKNKNWKAAQSQDAWDRAQGKTAAKPAAKTEQPSIKEQIAAGKKQLSAQKPAPPRAQTKTAEIGG